MICQFLLFYHNEKANTETFVDNWLLTGDAGNALTIGHIPGFRTFIRACRNLTLSQVLNYFPFIEERYYPLLRKVNETGNSSALLQTILKEYPILKDMVLYYIKGRMKAIIITKGQNISSREKER